MSTDPRELEQTLAGIQGRLTRIEQRLGLRAGEGAAAPATPPTVPPPIVATQVPVAAGAEAPPTLPSVPTPPVSMSTPDQIAARTSHLEEMARKRAAAMAERTDGASPPVVPAIPAPPVFSRHAEGPRHSESPRQEFGAPARAAIKRVEGSLNLEKMVGGRLAAYLGAIFLVIGLVMGVTYGIKEGWFKFEPVYRCMAVAICGLLLIGGGFVARRRLGANGGAVSAGLGAAGIGAMYGAALAGWGMYALYGAPVAFTLLALISVGGVALGLWWKSLPLGVLALLGAYLNPLWMHKEHSSPMVLPVYLLAMLGMGLVLSAWRPAPYRMLRMVSWWGTALLGSYWVIASGLDEPVMGIGFLVLVWGMVHGELLIGCWRAPEGMARAAIGAMRASVSRPMRSSFATTVWAVGMGMVVASFSKLSIGLEEWHIAAGGFVGTLGLALVLAGHMRIFRDRPENDRERLGVALWAQAGALLITTVALGVGGSMQVVAWLAMGVAATAAGRWARARSLDVYGVIVLLIAVGRLVVWERWQGAVPHEMFGVVVSRWSLLMAIGGAAWCAAAWMMQRPSSGAAVASPKRRVAVDLAMGMGMTIALAGCAFTGTVWQMMGVLGGVWAIAMFVAARWRESVVLRAVGIVGLGCVSAFMALCHGLDAAETLQRIPDSAWRMSIGTLVVTAGSLALVWLGAVWCVGAMMVERADTHPLRPSQGFGSSPSLEQGKWGSSAMVAMGLALALLAFVTHGTSVGAVSVAWVCVGLVLVGLHAWKRMLGLDVMGLATFVLAGIAWCGAYVIHPHDWLAEKYAALAHPGLWVGLAVAGAMIAAGVWLYGGRPRRGTWEEGVVASLVVGGVLLLVCTSLEVARSAGILLPRDVHAKPAALTVWWGVCAGVMLVIGFAAGVPIVRHLGLGLLGLASVKAVVYDLAGVELGWRVVSFLGLGVLMMGVAIAYAKLSSRLEQRTG